MFFLVEVVVYVRPVEKVPRYLAVHIFGVIAKQTSGRRESKAASFTGQNGTSNQVGFFPGQEQRYRPARQFSRLLSGKCSGQNCVSNIIQGLQQTNSTFFGLKQNENSEMKNDPGICI